MIVRSDAVVLRAIPYGETSQIVTLFTRERGKLPVIAKGSRVPGSRFGASLQALSYSQVVFYYRSGRGVQTLSEASIIDPLLRLYRDVRKLGIGMRVAELCNVLLHEGEADPLLFNIVLQVLHYLNEPLERPDNVLPYFQLRMAATLGFAPRIERNEVEAIGNQGTYISLDDGRPAPAGDRGVPVSRSAARAFAVFARADLETVLRMTLKDDVRREVEHLIEEYMRHHIEETYPTRAEKVWSRLEQLGRPNDGSDDPQQ